MIYPVSISAHLGEARSILTRPAGNEPAQPTKKRKIQQRDSSSFGPPHEMDVKMAMNMAVDLGLTNEDGRNDGRADGERRRAPFVI